ncbi:MAG: adenylate/guanylate cyclase domain-containing protein [Candidatus Nitrosocaldus sp.]|nr:adenylate/guanylate cyclase domain-containing protein [Candidatus Nitrosocaldus sp.]MDW8000360.1 adenylate/guanylate cyclase domain-containing protein [Candidatus Nitrosocaldus sp.]
MMRVGSERVDDDGRDAAGSGDDMMDGGKDTGRRAVPEDMTSIILGELSSSRVVDTQTYIAEVQSRMWKALKRSMRFQALTRSSEEFLKRHLNSKVKLVVLYADMVGSTRLSRMLPVERLAVIIQAFTQEMSFMVHNFNGLVLKYVGDAVIAYFPAMHNLLLAADDSVNCAISMIEVLRQGINPVLMQYDYPELAMKVSIDAGEHSVIQYGSDKSMDVDLVGYGISMAAKMHALAEGNSIVISHNIYDVLHPSMQRKFRQLSLDVSRWGYTDEDSGELYKIYMYKP